jgi:hypothetical protein
VIQKEPHAEHVTRQHSSRARETNVAGKTSHEGTNSKTELKVQCSTYRRRDNKSRFCHNQKWVVRPFGIQT